MATTVNVNLSSDKPFAEVAFNLPIKEVFTYKIPSEFFGKVQVGMRVFVPFGKRRITGYVVNLVSSWRGEIQLKSIMFSLLFCIEIAWKLSGISYENVIHFKK